VSSGFIFTPEAEDDLLKIWDFIAEDNSEASADRVIRRIYKECKKLSEMPGIGHYREDLLDRRHRFWCVWSYLIVYRWETQPLQVITVVNGKRDLDAFFASRSQNPSGQ
jgi:antitoxin ParD1/3/4/toxin ParE1/3/4